MDYVSLQTFADCFDFEKEAWIIPATSVLAPAAVGATSAPKGQEMQGAAGAGLGGIVGGTGGASLGGLGGGALGGLATKALKKNPALALVTGLRGAALGGLLGTLGGARLGFKALTSDKKKERPVVKRAFETTQDYRGPGGTAYTRFSGNRPSTMTMAPKGTQIYRPADDSVPGYEALVQRTDPGKVQEVYDHVDKYRTGKAQRQVGALGALGGGALGGLGTAALLGRVLPNKAKLLKLMGTSLGTVASGFGGAALGRKLAPTHGARELTEEDIERIRSQEVVGEY